MNSLTPLLLITAGAVLHAWWNYLVKRTGSDDVLFVWCYSALSLPPMAAVMLWWLAHGGDIGAAWWAGVVSMLLHTTYGVMLQKAYAKADMSVVYPVSRGLAPVIVTLVSLLWAQAPSRWGWAGMILVIIGAWVMSDAGVNGRNVGRGVGLGALLATTTAAYTLWDAYAASVLHVAVIPYMVLSSTAQVLLLSGVLWSRREELIPCLRGDGRKALPIAVLAPLSYALVILALHGGSPSMVATSRSLNVAVGSLFAIISLRERPSRSGAVGIGLICTGALASAL